MEMKKIVVASDSFKGSLSSAQVADYVENGILAVYPHCKVVKLSVADGGEGTVEALVDTLEGRLVEVEVSDPLMRPLKATYGIVGDEAGGEAVAVLEMSSASGLPLLADEERNPWKTSTYGTGEMIMDALGKGCRKFMVGIGGSATNDAGIGMLSALGFRFLDADGQPVNPCGGALGEIVSIDDSSVPAAVKESRFVVACDVDTPFCGPVGAAYVFARQKGADADMVRELDQGMQSFAQVVERKYGADFINVAGTGAAGGLGGAFHVFLQAILKKGVDMVLDAIGFDECIREADLVITGEGKLDFQTSKGKTPYGVMLRAFHQGIPTLAIGGSVELVPTSANDTVEGDRPDFAAVFPIVSGPVTLEEAMKPDVAARNVETTVTRIMNLVKNLSL